MNSIEKKEKCGQQLLPLLAGAGQSSSILSGNPTPLQGADG
eukprot:COSAG02_NODE_4539_length_5235_cov_10.265382_1_plen_40_part_10